MDLGVAYHYLAEKIEPEKNSKLSIKYSKKALEIYTKKKYLDDYRSVKNNLGATYYFLSNFVDTINNLKLSIKYYKELLDTFTKSNSIIYANINANLANSYSKLAEKLLDRLNICKETIYCKEDHFFYDFIKIKLDTSYFKFEESLLEKSISFYNKSLEIFSKENYPNEYALANMNLGRNYRILSRLKNNDKNIKLAITHYGNAIKYFNNNYSKLTCYRIYSSLLINTKSYIESYLILRETIINIETKKSNLINPESKEELLSFSKKIYFNMIRVCVFIMKENINNLEKYNEYRSELFKYIEMSKTRSLIDTMNAKDKGRIVFDESLAGNNTKLAEEIKLLDQLEYNLANIEKLENDLSSGFPDTRGFKSQTQISGTTSKLNEFQKEKKVLEKQRRDLLDKLYKYPHIKTRLSQINGEVISLDELQSLIGNELSSDTAILQYYLSDEIFIINIITKERVETIVEENSSKLKKLNYWIKLYNDCFEMFCSKYTDSNIFIKYINKIKSDYSEIGVYEGSNSGFNNFVLDLLGKELYKYLVEPAEEFIKDKKRLMFISQSYLHNFAFNILQKDNRFLIDTMELYKLPSASIWESLKDKSGFNFENITAFAVSKYIKLKELDGSRAEINNIENCFGFDNYLNKVTEDEVKPEVIKKYMKNANILSISGHGYSEKADSGYVYIDKKSNEDLKLSISRIFSSFPSFEKNALVVLSICHGGFQILTGEEISGINSVFLMLGAGAVISNLVPLWDDVGAEFSKNLYKKLSENLIDAKKDDLKDKLEIFYESLRELKNTKNAGSEEDCLSHGIEGWAFLEFQGNPDF